MYCLIMFNIFNFVFVSIDYLLVLLKTYLFYLKISTLIKIINNFKLNNYVNIQLNFITFDVFVFQAGYNIMQHALNVSAKKLNSHNENTVE